MKKKNFSDFSPNSTSIDIKQKTQNLDRKSLQILNTAPLPPSSAITKLTELRNCPSQELIGIVMNAEVRCYALICIFEFLNRKYFLYFFSDSLPVCFFSSFFFLFLFYFSSVLDNLQYKKKKIVQRKRREKKCGELTFSDKS